MKKIYFWYLLILIIVALMPQGAKAQNRTQRETSTYVTSQQAMDIGYAFMRTGEGSKVNGTKSSAVRKQAMQLVYTGQATDSLTGTTTDCYYVFALQPKGFVIVAADDRVEPILGYSYDNDFAVANMPDHVRGWLGDYEKQIQLVTKSDQQAESDIKTKWSRLKSGQPLTNTRNGITVGPLLTTTWDQAPYYNALCPEDSYGPDGHVLTGCVATAMAQIINYWGYPNHGRGIHSYNSNYGTLEVDYNNAQYDYANMPDALTSSSTQEQINAVAQLIYHCGVAADMGYSSIESGSYDRDARAAFINFFRFSPNLSIVEKDNFTNAEWNSLLQENIAANHPVMYGGQSMYGGHSFVCDGYNSDNYYHFNFGWSGNADGWYLTSAINPGAYTFNYGQTALIGIIPDSTGHVILGQMEGVSTFTVDEPMEFCHLLGHNTYIGIDYTNNCNSTTIFVSSDTTKQLVADIISFEGQNVSIYDGNQSNPSISLHEGDANNLSPVVSTDHTIKILYQGKFFHNGFKLNISQEDSCRMVSNVVTSVDTTAVHLSWTENGNATEWEIEYGLTGFSQGSGVIVSTSDTMIDVIGLTKFSTYDFYIRSVCGNNWFGPVSVETEAHYWTDVVTIQPEGYVEDEYGNVIISSAEGLAWFAKLSYSEDYAVHNVTLSADINLGQYKWKPMACNFSFVFDGQGHKIDSMYAIEKDFGGVALFQHIRSATLKNIYLTNCYIKQLQYQNAAGLVMTTLGTETEKSTVMNCYVSGRIEGHSTVAAIVAQPSYVDIINCVSNCNIIGGLNMVGGIAADGVNGGTCVIRNCYSAGSILSSATWKACIYGYADGYDIVENCYACLVRNNNLNVVGGGASVTFRDIEWFDETDSGYYLIRPVYFEPDNQLYSNLTDVLNAGVRKYNYEGLRLWVDDTVGFNEGMPLFGPEYVVTCPNVQNLSSKNIVNENGEYGVELSWTEIGDATTWEIEYHEKDSTSIVRVITTNHPDTIFGLNEQTSYVLRIRPICGISDYGGWSEEYSLVFDRPYWTDVITIQPEGYIEDADGNVYISSAEGLAWLSSVVNGLNGQIANDFDGKIVTLMHDVDMGEYKWKAMSEFSGTFDGEGHAISGLYVFELTNFQGLFGIVHGGRYMNIILDSATVIGKEAVGMLIGNAESVEIFNCHVSGTVFGNYTVGGMIGEVSNSRSQINVCSSLGTVQTRYDGVGGLIGNVAGGIYIYENLVLPTIRNSYSRCVVIGNRYAAGGLTGSGQYIMENCYATGDVYGRLYNGGVSGSITGPSYMRNCYGAGTVEQTGLTVSNGKSGYFHGSVLGSTSFIPYISNCYGLSDPVINFDGTMEYIMIGLSDDDYYPIVADMSSFTVMNDSIILLDSVTVGQLYYNNLLDALNAWVDTYDTAGVFLHWVADSIGDNGGFPKFEEMRYHTITLNVADDTPFGSVSGEGIYSNITPVIISATPEYGYHFLSWNDGNTDNPRSIKLIHDTTFTAIFEKNMYSIIGTLESRINYNFDYEDAIRDYQWTLQNGDYVNRWCIATIEDTNRALFISDNNGYSNQYSIEDHSINSAYTAVTLSSGQYNCAYDWYGGTGDLMTVALIPMKEQQPSENWTCRNLPVDAILLGSHFFTATNEWTHHSRQIYVPVTGEYFFGVFWENGFCCYGYNPASAIDNIQIDKISEDEDYHGYVLGSDTVSYLDTVVLTAVPLQENWYFSHWHDGNTDNPRIVVATADKYYIAVFEKCPDTTKITVRMPEDGYVYEGQTYTQLGIYTFNYAFVNACDSIVQLILTSTRTPVFYVTQNGTGNGSSWANAMGDLQEALDLAGHVQGDVWVAEGTYYGDGVSENAFDIPNGVHVYGGFAGNEPVYFDLSLRDFAAHPTILDGQHLQRTVYAWSGVALIDGFTIQNGYHSYHGNIIGGEVRNCIIQGGNGTSILYGVNISNSLIRNNTGREVMNNCNVFNSTIVNHSTSEYGYLAVGCTLTNCILWNNLGYTLYGTVSYSAVEEEQEIWGNWEDGNITLAHNNDGNNPELYYVRFVDPENGDFRLAYGSACINAGTPDVSGLGLPSVDLQGLPRVLDGRIDIGAYEYYPVPVVETYDTICEGGALAFFDSICAVEGQYLHHTSKDVMQDTLHILNLTINHATNLSFTVDTCDWYKWNDSTYRTSGTYTYTHEDVHGCTQVDTLHLTINTPTVGDTTATVCGSFSWYEYSDLTQSGDYTHTLTNAAGCDSTVTLHLTINNPVHTATTETVCGSYTWTTGTGITYTESGTYLHSHEDANGCIQVDTLHLTINNPVHTATTETACGSYTWTAGTGITYTESGTYLHSHEDTNGCIQVDTLHLTINNPVHTATIETVCGSYTWTAGTGTTYTESGTYLHSHEDVNGCIQVDTLYLTINNPVHTTTTETACGSYTWTAGTGITYTESGTYLHSHEDANGCTQVDTLYLTINNPLHTATIETACGSYTWTAGTGTTYTESGTYLHSHEDANGCIQVDTLYLTINNPVHTATTETVCGSYTWTTGTGTTYTESGTYLHSHEDANGCIQVDTLHLTINNPVHTATTETACESYTWTAGTGTTYTESGTYLHSHEDANGCMQVDTLHLTINNPVHTVTTEMVCGSYTWTTGTGITYTESGTYLHSHEDANGCTQVDTLHLTINNPVHTAIIETVCVSYTWTTGTGTTYTESGTYLHSHEDTNGCIQVDTLHLTINNPVHTATTETVCGSYTWTAGTGTTYTESGTYLHSHEDANGCLQVDTLHLTINNPVHTVTTETVCGSYTWTTGTGITYTESGTYLHSHEDVHGCTQVDTLYLTINNPVHTATIETVCGSYTWTTGTGITYTESGTYLHSHEDVNGCIQVDTLHLTINNPVHTATTETACGSYTWATGTGITYTESGTYLHSHEDARGCTQVDTLHLTINNPVHTVTTETVCGSYTWTTGTGITYTESGTYFHSHEDVNGCLQVDTLHLTINTPTAGDTTAIVCGNFNWYEYFDLTQSGDYTHTLTNAAGCDSTVILHLTVNQPVTTTSTATICDSELPYVWNGLTFNEAGTQSLTLQAANGCDSIIDMTITVNPSVTIEAYLTISDNDLPYTYGDTTFMPGTVQSGDYTFNFTSADGCDSIIILHLTVETGINNHDINASMKVYPNPTAGVLNVELTINNVQSGDVAVQIYDMYGKLLDMVNVGNTDAMNRIPTGRSMDSYGEANTYGLSAQTTQIDLSSYANGVYFIKAVAEGNVVAIRKIVKNR